MKINDKEYLLCDCCGSFKSSERCYNCKPLQASDTNICDELKPYYEIQNEQKIFKVKHHLLEYYFTCEQLIELGLYYNVLDWQILVTDNLKHSKSIKRIQIT